MAKCIKCNINVTDNTTVCPLCQRVLEPIPGEHLENTYPNVARKRKKMALALRIYLFCAIVAELILVWINLTTPHEIYWCVITGSGFVYTYLTLLFSCQRNRGIRLKILFQTLCAIFYLICIDNLTGYSGWSVTYVIPLTLISLDALVLILMLINRRSWQSYLLIQILLMVCSAIPFVLYFLHIHINLRLAIIAFFISVCAFLGSVIIGGKTAQTELSRRFHVN